MSKNQPQIPIEGDMIFEKESGFQSILAFFILTGIFTFGYCYNIFENGFLQIETKLHIAGTICTLVFVFMTILVVSTLKEGIKNETYEGFYFSDKLILYRISNYVDEFYTEKKSKETLLREIIELKDKISKHQNENDKNTFNAETFFDQIHIERKEKGVIITDNLRKPHKIIVEFKDLKYFLSEKGRIKVVNENQNEDSSDAGYFYTELYLTEKYKKNQSEIVEFLNKRVQECKNNIA